MNHTVHVPPAERDIPVGQHDERRRQLLEYASQPTAVRRPFAVRHIAPFAAAASVVAIAATAGLLAGQSHHSVNRAGHKVAPLAMSDATLAARCKLPGGQVLVRFSDALGGFALVRSGSKQSTCAIAPDGTVAVGASSTGGHDGPASYSRDGAELMGWGDDAVPDVTAAGGVTSLLPSGCVPPPKGAPRSGPAARIHCPATSGAPVSRGLRPGWRTGQAAYGTIGRNTARVVITWAGRAPITAAIRGHYFAARYFDPPGSRSTPGVNFLVQAYDAHGKLLTSFLHQD